MKNARVWVCLLLVYLTVIADLGAQQDPFKRSSSSKDLQSQEQNQEESISWREQLQQRLTMPPWFRDWQRNIQFKVSETALKIKQSSLAESWHLYFIGLLLAIAFGFLHIAGPGHGKVFVVSYFMSRKATLREGLWLSALINLVDSLSAGLVVFLTYGLLSLTFNQGKWVEAIISIISYGIIVVWGLWHLYSHLFGRYAHKHCHLQEHDHTQDRDSDELLVRRPAWYFALGIGLVPCPISTALLIFGLLNKILGVAIFLVAGVSIGGMIAMTLLSFAIIGGKKGFGAMLLSILSGKREGKLSGSLSEAMEVIALVLMIMMGGLLLLLSIPT